MNLAEKIKNWPMLAVHRFTEIEAILLSFEARLTALEPKKAEAKPEIKPTAALPFDAVRLGPTPSAPHDSPLDGERSDS